MDFNAPDWQNARVSIRVSLESDSKVTDAREEQQDKHARQRTSIDDGIQIDFNAKQQ
jgi:hypothetical protein